MFNLAAFVESALWTARRAVNLTEFALAMLCGARALVNPIVFTAVPLRLRPPVVKGNDFARLSSIRRAALTCYMHSG